MNKPSDYLHLKLPAERDDTTPTLCGLDWVTVTYASATSAEYVAELREVTKNEPRLLCPECDKAFLAQADPNGPPLPTTGERNANVHPIMRDIVNALSPEVGPLDAPAPWTANLFHPPTRHEIRAANGRIVLIADILPEHAVLIVEAVNNFTKSLDRQLAARLATRFTWLATGAAPIGIRQESYLSGQEIEAAADAEQVAALRDLYRELTEPVKDHRIGWIAGTAEENEKRYMDGLFTEDEAKMQVAAMRKSEETPGLRGSKFDSQYFYEKVELLTCSIDECGKTAPKDSMRYLQPNEPICPACQESIMADLERAGYIEKVTPESETE